MDEEQVILIVTLDASDPDPDNPWLYQAGGPMASFPVLSQKTVVASEHSVTVNIRRKVPRGYAFAWRDRSNFRDDDRLGRVIFYIGAYRGVAS